MIEACPEKFPDTCATSLVLGRARGLQDKSPLAQGSMEAVDERRNFREKPTSWRKPTLLFIAVPILVIASFLSGRATTPLDTQRRSHEKPSSVAVMGFIGREGSSWLMSLLSATQAISKKGKICVIGFEPLEHPTTLLRSSERKKLRQEFFLEFARIRNRNFQEYRAWATRLNRILARAHMRGLKIVESCDHRSTLFIFKARLAQHFSADGVTAEDSRWMHSFANEMRKVDGKMITLSRHNSLLRALTDNLGQFSIQQARTEEERQTILSDHARVAVDPVSIFIRAETYRNTTRRVADGVRLLGIRNLEIFYESFLGDGFLGEMTALLNFLDVPIDYDIGRLQYHTAFEKVSPNRLCEKVANYAGFCWYFQGTRYAGLLDDPCNTTCES